MFCNVKVPAMLSPPFCFDVTGCYKHDGGWRAEQQRERGHRVLQRPPFALWPTRDVWPPRLTGCSGSSRPSGGLGSSPPSPAGHRHTTRVPLWGRVPNSAASLSGIRDKAGCRSRSRQHLWVCVGRRCDTGPEGAGWALWGGRGGLLWNVQVGVSESFFVIKPLY